MAITDGAESPHGRESVPADVPVAVLLIGPEITWDCHTRERFDAVLDRGGRGIVICDVATIQCPTLGTLDVLLRLQLAARRRGWVLTLCGAHSEFCALLARTGLTDVLRVAPISPSDPVSGG